MDYKNYIETGLYNLLGRFVSKEILTSEVIINTENYLFKNESLPFFKNTELFETVIYLKDLMKINDLTTLEDIFCYYENERNDIKSYLKRVFENDELSEFSEIMPLKLKALSSDADSMSHNDFLSNLENGSLASGVVEENTDTTVPMEEC
jgi:hypothetical protein